VQFSKNVRAKRLKSQLWLRAKISHERKVVNDPGGMTRVVWCEAAHHRAVQSSRKVRAKRLKSQLWLRAKISHERKSKWRGVAKACLEATSQGLDWEHSKKVLAQRWFKSSR
jgi:hypothetical protein